MKISKLFHWLYFIVMMLPILSIPIFAIYSHRHTIDSYSVVRDEDVNVNLRQNVVNGYPNGYYNFSYTDDGYDQLHSVIDIRDTYLNFYISPLENDNPSFSIYFDSDLNIAFHDYVLVTFDYYCDTDGSFVSIYFGDDFIPFSEDYYLSFDSGTIFNFNTIYHSDSNDDIIGQLDFDIYNDNLTDFTFGIGRVQLFNLTTIFGSGNEPQTYSDFKSLCPLDYYNFGVDYPIKVGTHNVTYNDTDIGSQFIYDIYNVVDKYFNYDNVFNFNQLYDWLNLTFFNGGASLGFFIFWHLLIYWLLTSILWLVFDVLMYVPQLVHRWLDKASLS